MKLLLIAFLFVSTGTIAQVTSPLFTDSRGKIITPKAYGDISGSPYLIDKWTPGSVKTSSGKTFSNMNLKYDVAGERLLYITEQGDSMSFIEPVVEFEMTSSNKAIPLKFTSGFAKGDGISDKTFLQKIAGGKIALYKKYNVAVIESKGYGSQAINKLFNPSSTYYVLKDGSLSKITPSKKSILALFPNKEKEISDQIKEQKIDFKSDIDLEKLFRFLNQ